MTIVLSLGALVMHVGPAALAADVPPNSTASPWASGVSAADQAQAREHFAAANTLYLERGCGGAVDRYRQALALWNHPGIGVNLARCLVEQEHYVDGHALLVEALRFGQGPIDDDRYRDALLLRSVIERALARIVVVPADLGRTLTVNGQPQDEPASAPLELVVKAGSHVFVATKQGYQTRTETVVAPAGIITEVHLELSPVTETQTVYPMSPAVPWTVFGSGLAIAAAGIPLLFAANDNYGAYDAKFDAACPKGCPSREVPGSVRDLVDTADRQWAGAVTLFAVGGAAVVTGIVLLVLNEPRQIEVPIAPPTIVPTLTPSSAGVSVRF
ncbi:MAG: hypothetical protein ACI9MR_000147 [Myxococcota bacterium]|jgi:hypothetical protein